VQCREPPTRREVQIPYFEVQTTDFLAVFTDVALALSTRRNDETANE
jgi:hypothetical protein